MNLRSFLLALAACAAGLAGCGGSDVGAPRPAPLAVSSNSLAAPAAFVVRVGEGTGAQSFVVQITDAATIEAARRSMRGELQARSVLSGELRAGSGGVNHDPSTGRPWSWHLQPSTVRLVDFSAEIYDGRPSDIEGNLSYWLGTLGRYAPWSSHFERELTKKGK